MVFIIPKIDSLSQTFESLTSPKLLKSVEQGSIKEIPIEKTNTNALKNSESNPKNLSQNNSSPGKGVSNNANQLPVGYSIIPNNENKEPKITSGPKGEQIRQTQVVLRHNATGNEIPLNKVENLETGQVTYYSSSIDKSVQAKVNFDGESINFSTNLNAPIVGGDANTEEKFNSEKVVLTLKDGKFQPGIIQTNFGPATVNFDPTNQNLSMSIDSGQFKGTNLEWDGSKFTSGEISSELGPMKLSYQLPKGTGSNETPGSFSMELTSGAFKGSKLVYDGQSFLGSSFSTQSGDVRLEYKPTNQAKTSNIFNSMFTSGGASKLGELSGFSLTYMSGPFKGSKFIADPKTGDKAGTLSFHDQKSGCEIKISHSTNNNKTDVSLGFNGTGGKFYTLKYNTETQRQGKIETFDVIDNGSKIASVRLQEGNVKDFSFSHGAQSHTFNVQVGGDSTEKHTGKNNGAITIPGVFRQILSPEAFNQMDQTPGGGSSHGGNLDFGSLGLLTNASSAQKNKLNSTLSIITNAIKLNPGDIESVQLKFDPQGKIIGADVKIQGKDKLLSITYNGESQNSISFNSPIKLNGVDCEVQVGYDFDTQKFSGRLNLNGNNYNLNANVEPNGNVSFQFTHGAETGELFRVGINAKPRTSTTFYIEYSRNNFSAGAYGNRNGTYVGIKYGKVI